MGQHQHPVSRIAIASVLSALWLAPGPGVAAAANLASLTVNPKAVVSGSPLELTFALDSTAPAGGVPVTFTSSPAGIVSVPPSWGISAGATSNSLVLTAGAVAGPDPVTVTLTASSGSVTKTATLTVSRREPVRGLAGDLWADVILGQPDFGEVTFNEVTSRRV